MAKLVRRHTSNVEIVGSNPTGSIFFGSSFFMIQDIDDEQAPVSINLHLWVELSFYSL